MIRRDLLKMAPVLSLGSLAFTGGENTRGINEHFSKPQSYLTPDNIYSELGVNPLINARGTVTIIGATRVLPEVQDAMHKATRHYIQIDELMEAVGNKLARLTGTEFGCVTAGASAAITIATAACITGGDPDKIWKLPNTEGLKNEVIVPYYSRTAYECAARAAGAKMIEVSNYEEFKSALGPNTAMVLVLTGSRSAEGELSISKMSKLTKPADVPILADAAAEELRVPNPHIEQGADLVAYSGGKCLRGPQCAGLLLGRKDLVQSAWINNAPHHGFARGHKVGREEIIGMLTAVEMWFKRDHDSEQSGWLKMLSQIDKKISKIEGVETSVRKPGNRLSNRFPNMRVSWDFEKIPLTGYELEQVLWNYSPGIAVSGAGSFLPFPPNQKSYISINPSQMEPQEAQFVAEKLSEIFTNPPIIDRTLDDPIVDLSGEWDLKMKFSSSEEHETLFIKQNGNELMGSHTGPFTKREISGLINGDEILIRSSYMEDGVRLNFEFKGIVEGSDIKGSVSLSEYGMASWEAKRKVYNPPGKS